MNPWLIVVLLVVLAALAAVGVALWQIQRAGRRMEEALARATTSAATAADLNALRLAMDNRLDSFTQVFTTTSGAITSQINAAGETIAAVQQGLGEVRESSTQVVDLARNIKRLEEILRPPKARGAVGEVLLDNVLAQVLHPSHYTRQLPLAGAAVDFAVKVGGKYVPIDAKFPLESFERLTAAPEDGRAGLRREFAAAVQKKVDDIAAKYIRPDLGTYDFALMYIPSENIYYEAAIADGNLFDYAARKRVFPVSPATVYVYLATVALGLHGLALEGRAATVIADLRRLADELRKLEELFDTTGKHLRNAANKYDEAARQLATFGDLLNRCGRMEEEETPAVETDSPPLFPQ